MNSRTNKRTVISLLKETKELKEDRKKQISKVKEKKLKENKHPSDTQENTNMRLMMDGIRNDGDQRGFEDGTQ